jgi:PAS domain S-box-containing protein
MRLAASTLSTVETAQSLEEKSALAIRLSPDLILITTRAEGRCLDVNEACLRHTGYARDEMVGRTTHELNLWPHPADRRKMQEQLQRDGAVRGLEVEYRKKSGEAGYAVWHAAQILIEDEPCLLTMAQDITAYKQAQAALSQYAAELQNRNAELDAFAQTVAHDLKNPLGNIIGFSEYLQTRHELTEATRSDFVNTIARNAFKMEQIIKELLLLAQVRQGDLELVELDMGRVVGEAHYHLSFMIAENGPKICMPERWPAALGYGPWVEEVWVNYLSNAIKYGGRPPRVELGGEVLADQRVRYWVKDNGAGLPPELESQLFQPFPQLSTVRATGHGLGLTIVRQIGFCWRNRQAAKAAKGDVRFAIGRAPNK